MTEGAKFGVPRAALASLGIHNSASSGVEKLKRSVWAFNRFRRNDDSAGILFGSWKEVSLRSASVYRAQAVDKLRLEMDLIG